MDTLTLTDFDNDKLVAEPLSRNVDTGKLYVAAARHVGDEIEVLSVVLDRDQVADLARYLTTWLEEAPR